MAGLPEVTYLSMDPVSSTVGSSQVLAYVERLADRGVSVDLVTFEDSVDPTLHQRFMDVGVAWRPLAYGAGGAAGGLGRVLRAARAIRGRSLVHARSDLAAAAALVARPAHWIWDVRSFWADQKVATGVFGERSLQARVFRWVERCSAASADGVVTLTRSAIDDLDDRYGVRRRAASSVITTCVDRSRFPASPPPGGPVRMLLAGTINRYYDVPLMLRLVEAVRERVEVEFVVAAPGETPWESEFRAVGCVRISVEASEMPELVASSHVGLSVCLEGAGRSLLAAMPTKIGEFLATGRPVVVNPGLVDAAGLVVGRQVGVIADEDVEGSADRLVELLADPGLTARASRLAAEEFDLDRGIDRLVALYRQVVDC